MTNNPIHPERILAALLDKGNRKDKEEKLKQLYDLCADEYNRHSRGARDLSIANISRVAESHGLFKARTIYNKQSEDYATLIKAWAAYSGPRSGNSRKTDGPVPAKYGFLKKIEDPAVRCLCHIALTQRDKLKAELDLLKSQTKISIDMRPLGAELLKGARNVAVVEMAARLTDSERKALVAAITPDADTMKRYRWSIGEAGEVTDMHGRFVFLPGFVSAIRKVLGVAVADMLVAGSDNTG